MRDRILLRLLCAFIVLVPLTLSGCGFGGSPSEPRGGVEPFDRVDERLSVGQERVVFRQPLRGLSSSEHFVLEVSYLTNKGELILHSHFNGFDWRDGVRLGFKRSEGLTLSLSTPGFAPQTVELPADWISAEGRMKLRLEVQNGSTSGARVLIWKYNWSPRGGAELPRGFLSEANADFDSQKSGLIFQTHGRGVKWGLELDQVKLKSIYREAPYAE